MYKFDDKDAASPAILRNSISDAGKKAEPSSVINSMIISDVNWRVDYQLSLKLIVAAITVVWM